jgi:hypothetical protein
MLPPTPRGTALDLAGGWASGESRTETFQTLLCCGKSVK